MPTYRSAKRPSVALQTRQGTRVRWSKAPESKFREWFEDANIPMAVFGIFAWAGLPAIVSAIYMALK